MSAATAAFLRSGRRVRATVAPPTYHAPTARGLAGPSAASPVGALLAGDGAKFRVVALRYVARAARLTALGRRSLRVPLPIARVVDGLPALRTASDNPQSLAHTVDDDRAPAAFTLTGRQATVAPCPQRFCSRNRHTQTPHCGSAGRDRPARRGSTLDDNRGTSCVTDSNVFEKITHIFA
jgi:hypothetical protein